MHLVQTNQTVTTTVRDVPMRKSSGISLAERWSLAKILQQGENYDRRRLSHYILRNSSLGSHRLFRRNLDLGRLIWRDGREKRDTQDAQEFEIRSSEFEILKTQNTVLKTQYLQSSSSHSSRPFQIPHS